ncbi:CobW family GTP-binding protein [Sulfurospirillum deleyianum]|uniref:Cobalamin synthesis protein P47K n=1 Tax=Sulfurospirillum deleyianum (strain ATCC 51133 / DSM 6946 / 5175) TaxID=525898 RepID=D1B291_SULD5|nr:GTP-binding protein [Sulfurospirillum deleyianum]ACZ12211.1 cobalamin synthesis protein P47K [Sulfurospirillum deleyianum DSM 6946]
MSTKNVLPVTILTGFLGAGKTTLLNYLLEHNDGEKVAIIENEFGSVGVDGALLKGNANSEVIELSNGCVCCSIRGELTEALHDLLRKIDTGKLQVDRLILETTGVADPSPIVQTFFFDEEIAERIMLDAVIVLVDAIHVLKQLDEHRVCAAQIGFADRIILTKTDQIDDAQKELVLSRLHTINSKAEIFEAYKGALPKEIWLGLDAFEINDALGVSQGFYQAKDVKHIQFKNFSTQKPSQSWNDDIISYVFEAEELDIKKIGAFMEELVEEYGNDMLRYKGVLAIKDEPNRLIVQGVHKVVGFDYGSPFEQKRHSLLVVIGRKLPFEALKQRFLSTACV